MPPQHTFHKWVTAWAEKLEKESNGRLKITIYPNGQLVGPPNRQLDAARNGITDIAWVLHGVTPGRYPMTELANLPFAWKGTNADIVEMAVRMTELAPKYLAAEHTGLHILFMSMANPVVAYSKTPITKLDDFKGMKIRYASARQQDVPRLRSAPPPLLVPPPDSRTRWPRASSSGAMFPHEGGLAYDLGRRRQIRARARHRLRDLRAGDEPGEVQLAAAGPEGAARQGERRRRRRKFGKAWAAQEKFAPRARDHRRRA